MHPDTLDYCRRATLIAAAIAGIACGGPKRRPPVQLDIQVVNQAVLVCPVVAGISALPLEINVGFALNLHGFVTSGGTANYAWSASNGTFSTPHALATEYTCVTAGDHALTLTIFKAGCTSNDMTIVVTCTDRPIGDAAGLGDTGGSGG
jgi:hypothetical protein